MWYLALLYGFGFETHGTLLSFSWDSSIVACMHTLLFMEDFIGMMGYILTHKRRRRSSKTSEVCKIK